MRMKVVAALLVAGGCTSCRGMGDMAALDVPVCQVARPPVQLVLDLSEVSGVAVSSGQPGVLWTHADSGTDPILFALDAGGNIIGRTPVAVDTTGGEGDWEDIAAGACPSGNCLYIADTGDNSAEREWVAIHRLAEPPAPGGAPVPVETFRMRYPEGARDAEALFVLPEERAFVVTKGGDGPVAIYEYPGPLNSSQVATLRLVRALTAGEVQLGDRVTGASASPDGRWVALRTHVSVLVYLATDLLGESESISPYVVTDVRPLAEPQGEGVGFGPGGTLVLVSEGGSRGVPGTMSMLVCADLGD